jgi:predicted PurR-regulated permease PerM
MRRPTSTQQIERFFHLVLVGGLVVGCWLVLSPFLTAILFAVVIAISTWPVYEWVLPRVRGRRGVAALLCCLGVVMTLVVPAAVLAVSAADAGQTLAGSIRTHFQTHGPPRSPGWLRSVPVVGSSAASYWDRLVASSDEQRELASQVAAPLGEVIRWGGEKLGGGLLQLLQVVLAVFLLYFIYRDGHRMARRTVQAAERIAGHTASEMITVAHQTVVGVMLGMVATAVAQGLVAGLGFLIAGVPAAVLLGAATFVLSIIPFGPPLVWGGAAIYLYGRGETGWAIFIAIYGAVVISSVDNFLKPLLIARSSKMPLALTLLGVLGGVIAFGFMGLFIGPTLLAVAVNLTDRWLARQTGESSDGETPIAPRATEQAMNPDAPDTDTAPAGDPPPTADAPAAPGM